MDKGCSAMAIVMAQAIADARWNGAGAGSAPVWERHGLDWSSLFTCAGVEHA